MDQVVSYKKRIISFIKNIGKEMKKYLNLSDSTLIALKGIDPFYRKGFGDIKVLLKTFKHLYSENETELILEQVGIYRNLNDEQISFLSDNTSLDEFWFRIAYLSSPSAIIISASQKMPNLAKFFFRLCLIPHANVSTERTFSKYNLIKTAKRNRLKCETIQSLIIVKEGVEKKTYEEIEKRTDQILQLNL